MTMKAFAAGVVLALILAVGSGIFYSVFEITAEAYFSTEAARL